MQLKYACHDCTLSISCHAGHWCKKLLASTCIACLLNLNCTTKFSFGDKILEVMVSLPCLQAQMDAWEGANGKKKKERGGRGWGRERERCISAFPNCTYHTSLILITTKPRVIGTSPFLWDLFITNAAHGVFFLLKPTEFSQCFCHRLPPYLLLILIYFWCSLNILNLDFLEVTVWVYAYYLKVDR